METKLLQVDDPADFWCLIDELLDDKSGFFHNRNTLLKAFKDGTLYSLHIDETEEMFTSKKETLYLSETRFIYYLAYV